ncbi:hypothetical protein [Rhizobium sp. Leaf371]|uniref:hypothetical protein n=1 Tax=Rhizobium sp. Leaf371 TaxID=1736355 RepID=UPI0012E78250|nr:hypothetical protein [Rhizobium sp. Leaf371]
MADTDDAGSGESGSPSSPFAPASSDEDGDRTVWRSNPQAWRSLNHNAERIFLFNVPLNDAKGLASIISRKGFEKQTLLKRKEPAAGGGAAGSQFRLAAREEKKLQPTLTIPGGGWERQDHRSSAEEVHRFDRFIIQ